MAAWDSSTFDSTKFCYITEMILCYVLQYWNYITLYDHHFLALNYFTLVDVCINATLNHIRVKYFDTV